MAPFVDDDAAQGLLEANESGLQTPPQEEQLNNDNGQQHVSDQDHNKICMLLYTSHFLSTWQSRVFEFGAFLFLANIYPETLLPASVYALARAASAAVLSPWLGAYIDTADRLIAVRMSIGKP